MSIAEILLALLLILLAKGWTIVRKKISAQGRVKIAAFVTTYTWVSLTLQLHRRWAYNSAKMVYMCERRGPGFHFSHVTSVGHTQVRDSRRATASFLSRRVDVVVLVRVENHCGQLLGQAGLLQQGVRAHNAQRRVGRDLL